MIYDLLCLLAMCGIIYGFWAVPQLLFIVGGVALILLVVHHKRKDAKE